MFLFSIPEEPAPQRGQAEYLEKYISGISEGDKEALAGLYESTHAAVYGFALSLCKNTHDAEHVLQDVFLQIWNAAGQYTAAGKPMAWIFTITRNLSLQSHRRKGKVVPLPAEELPEQYEEAPHLTSEDRIVLESLLNMLGDEERQIVVLHALSEMKHREIASLLHLPLPTVLSKYRRAIKKLGNIVKEADSL